MGIKVFISGISASQEVRKRQQRVLFVLESLKIEHEVVDITEPDKEEDKSFMREACSKHDRANALPPQIFKDNDYLGDYDDFEVATESDSLRAFLQLPSTENRVQNGASQQNKKAETPGQTEASIEGELVGEQMVNGINGVVVGMEVDEGRVEAEKNGVGDSGEVESSEEKPCAAHDETKGDVPDTDAAIKNEEASEQSKEEAADVQHEKGDSDAQAKNDDQMESDVAEKASEQSKEEVAKESVEKGENESSEEEEEEDDE